RTGPFEAGVMISASHNPFEDNGLKVFGHDGTKLPDTLEAEVEVRLLDRGTGDPGTSGRTAAQDRSLVGAYIASLAAAVSPRWRSCSTARTARPPGSPPRYSAITGPTSRSSPPIRMGATSTWAAARSTSKSWPRRYDERGGTWESRSTGTPTAPWPSTGRG